VEIHLLDTENCYKRRVTSFLFHDGDIKLRYYRVRCSNLAKTNIYHIQFFVLHEL